MSRKYKFTDETMLESIHVLHRIVAVRNFGSVSKGDLGGWIESYENLSHDGNCWVDDDAMVFSGGHVEGNARVKCCAKVYLGAVICDDAIVTGHTNIYNNARVGGKARILDNATVRKNAEVKGNAVVKDKALVSDDATVSGRVHLSECFCIRGKSNIEKPTDYLAIGPLPAYAFMCPRKKSGKPFRSLYLVFSKVNDKICVNGDSPEDAKNLIKRLYSDERYLQKAMMEAVDMGIEQFEDAAN